MSQEWNDSLEHVAAALFDESSPAISTAVADLDTTLPLGLTPAPDDDPARSVDLAPWSNVTFLEGEAGEKMPVLRSWKLISEAVRPPPALADETADGVVEEARYPEATSELVEDATRDAVVLAEDLEGITSAIPKEATTEEAAESKAATETRRVRGRSQRCTDQSEMSSTMRRFIDDAAESTGYRSLAINVSRSIPAELVSEFIRHFLLFPTRRPSQLTVTTRNSISAAVEDALKAAIGPESEPLPAEPRRTSMRLQFVNALESLSQMSQMMSRFSQEYADCTQIHMSQLRLHLHVPGLFGGRQRVRILSSVRSFIRREKAMRPFLDGCINVDFEVFRPHCPYRSLYIHYYAIYNAARGLYENTLHVYDTVSNSECFRFNVDPVTNTVPPEEVHTFEVPDDDPMHPVSSIHERVYTLHEVLPFFEIGASTR